MRSATSCPLQALQSRTVRRAPDGGGPNEDGNSRRTPGTAAARVAVDLSPRGFTCPRRQLPLCTELLRLRGAGPSGVWRLRGRLVGIETRLPLPSLGRL